jgi:hypothetical protein
MTGAITTPIFSGEALRKAVDEAFAKVPVGHGCARLRLTLPDGTISIAGAARVGDHWMIQGEAAYSLQTHTGSAVVEVLCSW